MVPTRWRDRWVAWRNRRLANPKFQRWAADFPLTRPIALRRTRDLFDLVSGFVYSQTLDACLRLGVIDRLASGPATTIELATMAGLPHDGAQRLLAACAALRLVERAGPDRWDLGVQGAALLGAAGLKRMILHHGLLYADLADVAALLRRGGGGRLAGYWPYARGDGDGGAPGAVCGYSALMAGTQPAVSADVLDAYPVGRHRRLMDVGGGDGVFVAAAAARAPALELAVFDLPAVAAAALERFERAGLADRATTIGGDFLADPIPDGADLITLIRILHDHDDDAVRRLLRAVRRALPAEGALLVAEPMSDAPGADRVADVYFAFYLLAMGRGRPRSPQEISDFLREAGFRRVRVLRTRTPFLLRAILAQP